MNKSADEMQGIEDEEGAFKLAFTIDECASLLAR